MAEKMASPSDTPNAITTRWSGFGPETQNHSGDVITAKMIPMNSETGFKAESFAGH